MLRLPHRSPVLARQTAAPHAQSRNWPRTTGGLLPGARRFPSAAHPYPTSRTSTAPLADCHVPVPADQTTASDLPRTGVLLPPLPVPDSTVHAPGALPPVLHWCSASPVHTHGSFPASAGVERSCPGPHGGAGVGPARRLSRLIPGHPHHQALDTPAPPPPGERPLRRRRTGGRAAALLLRAARSSGRGGCAGGTAGRAYAPGLPSRRPAGVLAAPAVMAKKAL